MAFQEWKSKTYSSSIDWAVIISEDESIVYDPDHDVTEDTQQVSRDEEVIETSEVNEAEDVYSPSLQYSFTE